MTKHCKTCSCTTEDTIATLNYYADIEVGDVRLDNLEDVMELFRGMGFPRLFLSVKCPSSIRVFWTTGRDGTFKNLWQLFEEIRGIESYFHAYGSGSFSEPKLCGAVDGSEQYCWLDD